MYSFIVSCCVLQEASSYTYANIYAWQHLIVAQIMPYITLLVLRCRRKPWRVVWCAFNYRYWFTRSLDAEWCLCVCSGGYPILPYHGPELSPSCLARPPGPKGCTAFRGIGESVIRPCCFFLLIWWHRAATPKFNLRTPETDRLAKSTLVVHGAAVCHASGVRPIPKVFFTRSELVVVAMG